MQQTWVVGSLNVDLVVSCDRFPLPGETVLGGRFEELPGGKGGNQAMALARLGAPVRLVAAVGSDPHGQRYLASLKAAGVDTSRVNVHRDVPTGVALIEVCQGENRIVVVPGANQRMTPEVVTQALAEVERGDVVLFQLEIPLEAVWAGVRVARARGARVVVDPAPAVALPNSILPDIDFLTPNETEARIAADLPSHEDASDFLAAQRLVERGCPAVVQKSGARGAVLVTASSVQTIPAFPVKVVDTIGAGDSFNAGFAWALSQGQSALEAARWGNAAGALATRGVGAQGSLATSSELQAMLESFHEAENPVRR